MSSKLRDDNECQNCGYTVDVAYCSKCGQKNTETRQPFHHLFTHFIEDLVHYDGAFWKTIKHLLLRPARLTKEYLIGKRQTYVAPVKLYIFISFVTFFLISFVSDADKTETKVAIASTPETFEEQTLNHSNMNMSMGDYEFNSLQELEAFLNSDEADNLNIFQYWIAKSMLLANNKNLSGNEVLSQYFQTLPKVLFLYMPFFAFCLWLFHGKKRWYFFDHGIFTLHYFSFLLLGITLLVLIDELLNVFFPDENDNVTFLLFCALSLYYFFYFFRAHRRMYGEKRWISRLKSLILFFINITLITIVLFVALFYALSKIH